MDQISTSGIVRQEKEHAKHSKNLDMLPSEVLSEIRFEGKPGSNLFFNKKLAVKYGVNGATFLTYMFYWLGKNKAANRNYVNGKFWLYNSVSNFLNHFEFWTEKQLRKTIKDLENAGAIQSGCYNKAPFDRTRWYTLGDQLYPKEYYLEETTEVKEEACESDEESKSVDLPKRAKGGNYKESHLPKRANAFAQKGKCICPKGQTYTSRVPVENPCKKPYAGDEFYLNTLTGEWGYRKEDIDRCIEWVKENRQHIKRPLAWLSNKKETLLFVLTQISIMREQQANKAKRQQNKERREKDRRDQYEKGKLVPLQDSLHNAVNDAIRYTAQ